MSQAPSNLAVQKSVVRASTSRVVQNHHARARVAHDFRRRAWRSLTRLRAQGVSYGIAKPMPPSVDQRARNVHPELGCEFMTPTNVGFGGKLRRVVGLTSDVTLLVLLSPIFLAWFGYHGIRRMMRSQ